MNPDFQAIIAGIVVTASFQPVQQFNGVRVQSSAAQPDSLPASGWQHPRGNR